ncbi:MAG: AAA family ATPase [Myxococcales bacterium]|nr:AAA family ATPase [Myxococcales bacterium]
MKIAEIAGGTAATLNVRSLDRPLLPAPQLEQEVALVRSGDQALLQMGGDVWAVVGVTPSDAVALTNLVDCGLPTIAYVARASTDSLVVETRRFCQALTIPEPFQVGVDDKVVDELRSNHRVSGTVADMAQWLADRLFLPPAIGVPAAMRRLVVSADNRGRLDAFRIYGLRIAVDVRRVDNKLRLERVVRGGRNTPARLTLATASISLVDATVAAELHGAVRTTLTEAVANGGSYLKIWQQYHQLEQDIVARRAQTFGAVKYKDCQMQRNGAWRFVLEPVDDLLVQFGPQSDWERFELMAGTMAPGQPQVGAVSKAKAKQPQFCASIAQIDAHKNSVEFEPPDEDEEQPAPPQSGYLWLSTSGDDARLARRARAEEALRTGNCPLPQLGLLMEGRPAPAARRQRVNIAGPALKSVISAVFRPKRPTTRQLAAIEMALNTPDVCLIQGPPGTGKTKVITAIEQCLAVLADEGVEHSHRILVCAAQHDAVETVAKLTEVFGLPAVKVGRRRHDAYAGPDAAQIFASERIDLLRSGLKQPAEAERLDRVRKLVLACSRTAALPAEQAKRIREVLDELDGLLAAPLRDRALAHAAELVRPVALADPEAAALLLQAARGIRVEHAAFGDDGPQQARKALVRLAQALTTDERVFLERCAVAEPEPFLPWMAQGRAIRDALIDRLAPPPPNTQPRLDEATRSLLLEIVDHVDRRRAASRTGIDATVAAFIDDLEGDPEGVREAIERYTVVLAATLQQAAGKVMRQVRGVDFGQVVFESVIVDEAARANPLDLFIPLSMASRRVVLVGDHRQLPHLLEPDVEREMADGVEKGTVEQQTLRAVQASLFERMWLQLRALEQQDGIARTITLDAQFRMPKALGEFLSQQFYERNGDVAIESPSSAEQFHHELPGYANRGEPCAAAWLDVPADDGDEIRAVSKSRPAEATAIAREVHRLIDLDSKLTFGIIAFYSDQVDEIGRAMLKHGLTESVLGRRNWRVAERWATTCDAKGKTVERLRIGTVDAFQGKEFDVVFLSVTRSNWLPADTEAQLRIKYGHLMLENRLCVAMSRQQRLLVVVGDLAFVEADAAAKPLRALQAFVALCRGPHATIR